MSWKHPKASPQACWSTGDRSARAPDLSRISKGRWFHVGPSGFCNGLGALDVRNGEASRLFDVPPKRDTDMKLLMIGNTSVPMDRG